MTNADGETGREWRRVLADYRYLRATLNALVQPDRQLSVEELVDSALNHDTMHGDTAMVILMQLDADHNNARLLPEALAALRECDAVIDAAFTLVGHEDEDGYEVSDKEESWMTTANAATGRIRALIARLQAATGGAP